ncbi:choice-of-anchor J domain-containing protein [Tenacibaculum maritimum]|uniref:choice-of-anchor J domain-containing protein n=1 Tax=Tenacibaculum maritimum TaxID=107401 RepID=UPI0038762DD7
MKQKIIILFILFVYNSFGQIIISEGFEGNNFPPDGWKKESEEVNNVWSQPDWERANYNQKEGEACALYEAPTGKDDIRTNSWLITKVLRLEVGKTYEYSFWTKVGASYLGTPSVDISLKYGREQKGSALTNIIFTKRINNANYNLEKDTFTVNESGEYYIGIHVGNVADLYVDEFLIKEKERCNTPENLKLNLFDDTQVGITWSEVANKETYNYRLENENGEEVITDETVENHVLINGLEANTTYVFYVKTKCTGGLGESEYSKKYVFKTSCVANDALSEDFTSAIGNELPNCWSSILDGVGISDGASVRVISDRKWAILGNHTSESTANILLVSPKLSNINSGKHRLRFKAKGDDINVGSLEVGVLSGNEFKGADFIKVGREIDDLKRGQFKEYVINFDLASLPNGVASNFIAFKNASRTNYTISVDDIYWEPIPKRTVCTKILVPGEDVSNETFNPYFKWESVADAAGYKIHVGTQAGANDIYTKDVENVSEYQFVNNEGNLEYDTTYFITIIPYNEKGDAQNCEGTSIKLITMSNPNYGGGDVTTSFGGYYYANSAEEAEGSEIGKATYNWIDPITNRHVEITQWDNEDNDGKSFKIPTRLNFEFPFYEEKYNDNIYVNYNGSLHFGNASTINYDNNSNFNIPEGDAVNNFIAACLSGYEFQSKSKVYYKSLEDKFIVTWYEMENAVDFDENTLLPIGFEEITFQLILYKNGKIKIQINNEKSKLKESKVQSIFSRSIIGMENSTGTKAVLYRRKDFYNDNLKTRLGPIFNNKPTAIIFVPEKQDTAGINDEVLASKFSIYPNPANNYINIATKEAISTISIINLLGEELDIQKGKKILLKDLSKGVYLLKIKTKEDKIVIQKIIKK